MTTLIEFIKSICVTVLVYGHIVKKNMAYVWEVPYVPLTYIGIGCLIGSLVL